MNVTAHQEKEKNEETKTGKRKAGEERRRQATDFKKAECCPSVVVQGAARRKNGGECQGNWDPQEGQQPFRPNKNGVGDSTTSLKRLLIGAGHYAIAPVVDCSVAHYCASSFGSHAAFRTKLKFSNCFVNK